MSSSHKATEDPDETQASDASQFDLASERPCVCMCVESEAGGRSVWVHDSGMREISEERLFQCWRWSCVDATPGCARLLAFLWLFVFLWTLFWPRLLCWNEEAQAGHSGMNSHMDNASVMMLRWSRYNSACKKNYCMDVTPEMLDRWLLRKCCFAYFVLVCFSKTVNCSSCICSAFDFSVCFALNCADGEWVSMCVCCFSWCERPAETKGRSLHAESIIMHSNSYLGNLYSERVMWTVHLCVFKQLNRTANCTQTMFCMSTLCIVILSCVWHAFLLWFILMI